MQVSQFECEMRWPSHGHSTDEISVVKRDKRGVFMLHNHDSIWKPFEVAKKLLGARRETVTTVCVALVEVTVFNMILMLLLPTLSVM